MDDGTCTAHAERSTNIIKSSFERISKHTYIYISIIRNIWNQMSLQMTFTYFFNADVLAKNVCTDTKLKVN